MFYRISGVLVGMGVYMSPPTRRDAWQAGSPGLRMVAVTLTGALSSFSSPYKSYKRPFLNRVETVVFISQSPRVQVYNDDNAR
jgi:hypothetical protein